MDTLLPPKSTLRKQAADGSAANRLELRTKCERGTPQKFTGASAAVEWVVSFPGIYGNEGERSSITRTEHGTAEPNLMLQLWLLERPREEPWNPLMVKYT